MLCGRLKSGRPYIENSLRGQRACFLLWGKQRTKRGRITQAVCSPPFFPPGRGVVAPTQAAPKERHPILLEALSSTSKERRLLGLKACAVALEAHHFTRSIGAEFQGLTEVKDLWSPKTWGEVFDAYRDVWRTLVSLVPDLGEDEKREAVGIILQHARGLASYGNLSEMVIDTLRTLATDSQIDKKKI